jgi:hypothetical protein
MRFKKLYKNVTSRLGMWDHDKVCHWQAQSPGLGVSLGKKKKGKHYFQKKSATLVLKLK